MKCTRECKFCKNIFQPKRVDSFFCSESCRSKNYRFERFKYVQQHQIKCAVLHCESFAYKTNMCNAHYSKTMYKPKKEFLINCIFCKKEFYTKRTNTKFCSTNCAQTFRARLNGVEPKKLIATCVCKQCNVEYKPKKGDRTTFCSRACSLKYMTVHGKTKFYKISLDNAKQRRKKRKVPRRKRLKPRRRQQQVRLGCVHVSDRLARNVWAALPCCCTHGAFLRCQKGLNTPLTFVHHVCIRKAPMITQCCTSCTS